MSELFFTCFTFKWQTELVQNESHLGAGFSPRFRRIQWKTCWKSYSWVHQNPCRPRIPKSSNKCESILSADLHLEFGFASKWSQPWSAKTRDPQALCSWGPRPSLSCTASDATSTRSFTTSTWPSAAAKCNGVRPQAAHAAETCAMFERQEIRRRFELDWPKSSKVFITEISYIILIVNILSEQVSRVKGKPRFEKKNKSFESAARLHGTWSKMDQHGMIYTWIFQVCFCLLFCPKAETSARFFQNRL